MDEPWLSIIGLNEDGPAGLSDASRDALAEAEIVFGGTRHLALIGAGERGRSWPVPFDIAEVLVLRGRRIAVLASGDPFWFGVGKVLARALPRHEWRAFPAPGTFTLAAARLGWPLEDTACLGLHAAPFTRLVPYLAPGWRGICLLRDGKAVAELAKWLVSRGWGASQLQVMEALGGPRERIRHMTAWQYAPDDIQAPVCVAIEARGGEGLPRNPGLPEALFAHDGQITKSPIRAITLAALAPRHDELLWDLGAGSGSISVEWALAGGHAAAVEQHAGRAANIRRNAEDFGLDHRIAIHEGRILECLAGLPAPDAIFVGGGFDMAVFEALPRKARLVVNAVTLETGALLADLHCRHGGDLLRLDLSHAEPLGPSHSWAPARPLLQWRLPSCA
ncbi:MAG: precorrin-6y C5,15-methyltransferase (decarboxylating) subunit CbiE [Pseudorhodobacter sp.]